MGMTASKALADFAVTAQPDPSLAGVVTRAVADCFGCILAGAESDVARRARSAFSLVGSGDSPVFGTTATLPRSHAALVNAVAGHAWELDDWEEPGNTHPTVILLPALLAAAHLRPASGARLLAAYSVGTEIIMRLGVAVSLEHYTRGFHTTATLGTIGVAGAVARLLSLTPLQTTHALSIAASQATGYTIQFGTDAKPLQAGFAARAGLEAACLAASGATGQSEVIDNPRGLAGLMAPHSPERFAELPDRIGSPWALEEHGLVLKPWPSCGYTHRLMTAALELRTQLHGETADIVAIDATLPDFHHAILPFHRPRSRKEALFSVPACVAQTLAAGTLTLDDSASEFWTGTEVERLIDVTTVTPEPARNRALNYDPDQPDRLTITRSTGEVLEASCVYPLGAAQNPMSDEHLADKWNWATGRPEAEYWQALSWVEAPDVAGFFMELSR